MKLRETLIMEGIQLEQLFLFRTNVISDETVTCQLGQKRNEADRARKGASIYTLIE
jgi:hypothetical protein